MTDFFLVERRSAVSTVPENRWRAFDDGSPGQSRRWPPPRRLRGSFQRCRGFRRQFFGITPRGRTGSIPSNAWCWRSLSRPSNMPASSRIAAQSLTGVFVSACVSGYGYLASRDLRPDRRWTGTGGALTSSPTGCPLLDLRAVLAVDTACVHPRSSRCMACRACAPVSRTRHRRCQPPAGAHRDAQFRRRRGDVEKPVPCRSLRRRRGRIRSR